MAPAPFYAQPEIPSHLSPFWAAFLELGTERQIGMGIGAIPVSRINAYARDELDLDDDGGDRFRAVIRLMDDAYLALVTTPNKGNRPAEEIAVDDVAGTRQLFRNIASRRKHRKT
jgi:hypothetical protein